MQLKLFVCNRFDLQTNDAEKQENENITDPDELVSLFALVESLPQAFDSSLRLLDRVSALAL